MQGKTYRGKKPQPKSAARETGPGAGVSFASFLRPLVPPASRAVPPVLLRAEPLAHVPYADELGLKNRGLEAFWQHHRLPGIPEDLIPSPRARGYRTTSKRIADYRGSTLFLLFSEKDRRRQKRAFLESALEPVEHARVYRALQEKLSEAAFRPAARRLNYLIVRGTYEERIVIFNVDALSGPVVRKFKMLGELLQKLPDPVVGAYLFVDPTSSEYYLESRRPSGGVDFKRLFGPKQLSVAHHGHRYLFPPTSFSQVNESLVPTMLDRARDLLAPEPDQHLLDLYCGYGLFSHFLSPGYGRVTGVDGEGPAVRAAEGNGRRVAGGAQPRFLARKITPELFDETLPPVAGPEAVLLDPPRQGPDPGVIPAIARRRPQKVLHIFCGVEEIPVSLGQWDAEGYRVRRIVPLDMFPGTMSLEVLVLLAPGT